MAIELSEKQRKLVEGKNFAYLGTVAEDGTPQVTPVWIDYDGKYVIFNTEKKRANVRERLAHVLNWEAG